MNVRTDKNKYYVSFEQDRRESRAITRCKIFLLAGSGVTLMGQGSTLQGKTDVFNSVTGCTFAMKRALENYGFQKSTRTLFWKEFNRCHRRVTCREAFANIGKLIDSAKAFEDESRRVCAHRMVSKGSGSDWCMKHRHHCVAASCRAMKKMLALGTPTGRGVKDFYARSRHEYGDKPDGDQFTGFESETVVPRSHVEKSRQLCEMYNADYSKLGQQIRRHQQAEDRCHRVGDRVTIINTMSHADVLKAITNKHQVVRDILDADTKRRRVEKPHWLRRVGRAVVKWWNETERI